MKQAIWAMIMIVIFAVGDPYGYEKLAYILAWLIGAGLIDHHHRG